jgi:hypothetical protein
MLSVIMLSHYTECRGPELTVHGGPKRRQKIKQVSNFLNLKESFEKKCRKECIMESFSTIFGYITCLDWTVLLHTNSLTSIHVCNFLLPSFVYPTYDSLCSLQCLYVIMNVTVDLRHEWCNRVPRSIKNKALFDRLGPSTILSPRTDMPFRQSGIIIQPF